MKEQTCNKCGLKKDINCFEWSKKRPNPRKTCAVCRNKSRIYTAEQRARRSKAQSDWYFKNKEKSQIQARIRNYGINNDDYVAMLYKQNGKCAICLVEFAGDSKKTHVDHCHETNKVRGLLCSKCNPAIGLLGEDIGVFRRAIEYLIAHS